MWLTSNPTMVKSTVASLLLVGHIQSTIAASTGNSTSNPTGSGLASYASSLRKSHPTLWGARSSSSINSAATNAANTAGLESYLAAHLIITRTSSSVDSSQTNSANSTSKLRKTSPSGFKSAGHACPASCDDTGSNPNDWTAYHDPRRLARCNNTMLLDFTISNALNDSNTQTSIYACTAASSSNVTLNDVVKRAESCQIGSNANQTQVQAALELAWVDSTTSVDKDDVITATQQLEKYLSQKDTGCKETIAFAYHGKAVVGIFAGAKINVESSVLEDFVAQVGTEETFGALLAQHCAGNGLDSNYAFGVMASTASNLAEVQHAVKTWQSAGCINSHDGASSWNNITLNINTAVNSNTTNSNTTSSTLSVASSQLRSLHQRDTCSYTQVAEGASCSSLAIDCGISGEDFLTYNPDSTLCSTLAIGQYVCCSSGDLPDFSPQPNANGTCATYLIQSGDYCSKLSGEYSVSIEEIESYNTQTWGWLGCDNLQAGYSVCLSSGDPPMPPPVSNAICGPQVPGTIVAPSGTNLSQMNQCDLNACCDVWGQCGVTAEFCTITQSATGNPGTAAAGTNGCISNCGTDIIVGDAPAEFFKVGYFEGYNSARPCLNMPVSSFDTTGYTHIHLSFATFNAAFEVDVSDMQDNFNAFVKMTGFKRILSFGGWAFSTDPATYNLFRDATATAENRQTLATNVAAFVAKYGLDGVDFDWEYPAEPDIPGIPAGGENEGTYYDIFFGEMAAALPEGTSLSVTAPTSYWYLKPFLIETVSTFVDYIVYMTYDLHGQWDYDNQYSDEGCPEGNCLRSAVNITETLNSLSMITKAGVPSAKVIVGVTSYGRSFQMTTAGCYDATCTYTGPESGAYAGVCTGTPGYIANAEINGILNGDGTVLATDGSTVQVTGSVNSYLDEDSYSNIVVYDDTQWISYMDDANKAVRTALFKSYNFGGTADWAVDLQSYDGDNGSGTGTSPIVYVDPSIWTDGDTSGDNSISCEPPCVFVLPPYPLGSTTTVTWPALTTTLLSSSSDQLYTVTSTISVPPFVISEIPFQPITMGATDTDPSYIVFPVQSIMPPAFIWTIPAYESTFSPTPIPTTTGTSSSSSSTSVVAGIIPTAGTWYTTPVPITIQPQPTISISVTLPPPMTTTPFVTISTGTQKTRDSPTPTAGSGTRDCGIFGCKPYCGLFGCDGGCGIFGCGGGCGPLGCIGDCPLWICGGTGCEGGACGYGSSGSGGDDSENDCDDPVTASACTYVVSSFSTTPMTEYSTTTKTHCETSVECGAQDTKTTTTKTTSEAQETGGATVFLDPAEPTGIDYAAIAAGIRSMRSDWDSTRYSWMTTSTTEPEEPEPTATVAPDPPAYIVPMAACDLYDEALWYDVTILTNDWGDDEASNLLDEESGCGDLLSWEFIEVNLPAEEWGGTFTATRQATFTLPQIFAAGCVERAIASAGGPSSMDDCTLSG